MVNKKILLPVCLILMILLSEESSDAQARKMISLNDGWIVRSIAENDPVPEKLPTDFNNPGVGWYKGSVPKQVQEFILEKGELPDPHYGDNVSLWVPVFQKEWIYCKRFNTPQDKGRIELCMDGIDTGADIILNGRVIAYCNNMHLRWRIPIDGLLNAPGGSNLLIVRFYPVKKMIERITAGGGSFSLKPSARYIRKAEYDFANTLGANPHFMKMGIFDNIFLDVLPVASFGDPYIFSRLNSDFSTAVVNIAPDVRGKVNTLISLELTSPSGKVISRSSTPSSDTLTFEVKDPELWWPLTYGRQPLYRLKMQLKEKNRLLDERMITFGIRDVKMELTDRTTGDPRFGFRINGRMIFMHGVNMTMIEGFTHTWDESRSQRLLDLARMANFNFIRIHGKGRIPDNRFFEKCDREGITVWMDFMTGSGISFPVDNKPYLENIKADITDEIVRLRNFTSVIMWCGGNEHFLDSPSNSGDITKPLGRELIQKIMPGIAEKYDPNRYFHPSSPWGGDNWPNGNYPLEGDYHDYWTFKYSPMATVPLFASEIGMVSPYSLHNMRKAMPEEDIWPDGFRFTIDRPGKIAWPEGWQKHVVLNAFEKIGNIQDYCDIQSAEDAVRVFGTAHGQYLKERYERQRRGVPDGQPDGNRRSWGAAIWRLNDAWPMIYMAVVDYFLEPKIPYYFLKRACEPVLVSFEQTPEKTSVWVVNDSPEIIDDSLTVELWSFAGKMKKKFTRKVLLRQGHSKRVEELTYEFNEIWKRDDFLVARLGTKSVTHLLWPEKYLKLKDAEIRTSIENNEITLLSPFFVKEVEISIPGASGFILSDNYFNLIPGEEKKVKISGLKGGSLIEIKGVNSNRYNLKSEN